MGPQISIVQIFTLNWCKEEWSLLISVVALMISFTAAAGAWMSACYTRKNANANVESLKIKQKEEAEKQKAKSQPNIKISPVVFYQGEKELRCHFSTTDIGNGTSIIHRIEIENNNGEIVGQNVNIKHLDGRAKKFRRTFTGWNKNKGSVTTIWIHISGRGKFAYEAINKKGKYKYNGKHKLL